MAWGLVWRDSGDSGLQLEVEFVAGAVRASQSDPVELQEALEVREHLDLLPLTARSDIGVRGRKIARCVADAFMDGAQDPGGGHVRAASPLQRGVGSMIEDEGGSAQGPILPQIPHIVEVRTQIRMALT